MKSHELAAELLKMPNIDVKLYTDHGQTVSECLSVTLSKYSEEDEISFEKDSDTFKEEDYTDMVDIVEIYGD